MKILHIDYNKLSDAINDCEIRYEVIESSVNLNKNPFSVKKQKLVGNYYLKVKKIIDYNWFWKKDKVDIFSFKGRFECGKNMWLP